MSSPAMSAVWGLEDITSTERLVLLALAEHAQMDGVCWPSQRRISDMTSFSEKCVRNTLLELTRKGLLTRQHYPGKKGRSSDTIWLTFLAASDDQIDPQATRERVLSKSLPARRSGTHAARGAGTYRNVVPSHTARRSGEPIIEPENRKESAQGRSPLISGDLGTLEEQRAAILADPLNKANWKTDG